MKNGYVVIGAGFGDEGKGLMTDALCDKHKANLVVRFNSGAQAAHTVVRGPRRHVFSHFGSGTFLGVPTYLSEHFVAHPMHFRNERKKLQAFGIFLPATYVHPECIVTTPYDVLLNQLIEKYRNAGRHGSCGMGFNETIIRHLGAFNNRFNDEASKNEKADPAFSLFFGETIGTYRSEDFRKKLKAIRSEWFMSRVETLTREGVFPESGLAADELSLLRSDGLIENFLLDLDLIASQTRIADAGILSRHDTIVFEGAQGLQLAQDSGNFPHVTRSYTGRRNVASMVANLDYESLETVYVSRCYQTKHGAGPFTDESVTEFIDVEDPTNIPNEFQGTIRTAYLDLTKLFSVIGRDIRENPIDRSHSSFSMTCQDQCRNAQNRFYVNGELKTYSGEEIQSIVFKNAEAVGINKFYSSTGPSAQSVKEVI